MPWEELPRWLSGKEAACHAGGMGSIPESGRSSEEGNGNPLQYLAWKISWTEEHGRLLQSMGLPSQTQLSNFTHSLTHSLTQGCYRKIKKVISEEKNSKLVIQEKIHVFLKKLKLKKLKSQKSQGHLSLTIFWDCGLCMLDLLL